MNYQWIAPEGGNLVVLPRESVEFWLGASEFDDRGKAIPREQSHQAQALAIRDYLSLIELERGWALVLSGEPLYTCFTNTLAHPTLLRLICANELEEAQDACNSIPESIWTRTDFTVNVGDQGLVLIDSYMIGPELHEYDEDSWCPLDVEEGRYAIETAEYEPERSTSLLLHRFRRL